MSFIWKLVKFLAILDFTGFASIINTDFRIIFLNALFSLIEPLIDIQFAIAYCLLINVLIFSVIDHQS